MAKIPFDVIAEEDLRVDTIAVERSFSDKLLASYKRGMDNTPFASIQRLIERSLVDDGEVLSAEELNAKFKDVEKPFQEPMSIGKAKLINKQAQDTKMLNNIIESGETTFGEDVLLFGTSMIPEMIDPVNIASGLGIAQGINKILGKALTGTGVSIAEGVTGNLLADFGVVAPLAEQEQRDINSYEMLATSIASGVGMPLIFAGVKNAIRGLSKVESNQKVTLMDKRLNSQKKLSSITDEGLDEIGRERLIEVENSKEQDLDYDPLIQEEVDNADISPDVTQDLEESLSAIDGIRDLEDLSADELEIIQEFDNVKASAESVSRLHTLATHCIRKS